MKNYSPVKQPIHRGPWRMWLGKRYFIARRYWKWYFGGQVFAKEQRATSLPHCIFTHKTPLLRKLKRLDMRLQYNKINNLRIASERISGLVIPPRATFSFWYLVGRTSKAKGYLPGMMLRNGQIVEGTGGGLCQMSNLIYWMLLHSGLTVTERWRHSFDVFPDANRTQPFGSGATLAYNYVDLQCINEKAYPFQLKIWLSDSHLHGAIYAAQEEVFDYEIEERNHQIVGEAWGGYTRHNQIIRKVLAKKDGQLVREEPVVENHAVMMYQPFLE